MRRGGRSPAAEAEPPRDSSGGHELSPGIAELLALRLRVRRNPPARALVDRGLWLLTQIPQAGPDRLDALEREVAALARMLRAEFGRRASAATDRRPGRPRGAQP
jgi:hypothetical protein